MTRIPAAALLALIAVCTLGTAPAAADQPGSPTYRQAVSDALQVISSATPGDVASAQQAASILKAGTGDTQPEILHDLAIRPPDFADARTRLTSLLQALDGAADTSDPASAKSKLHDILSQHRYDALRRPPSALERLGQWILDRIRDLLRALFGGSSIGGVIPNWVVYVIGALIIAAVAFVVFRSAGGRLSGDVDAAAPGAPRPPADYFAEADRLAAMGDHVGAIRALCAAVAATLSGEKTWEGSPLTVREMFARSSDPRALRPLLLPFEAAVYGGRDVDRETYGRALAAASPFRARVEAAA